MLTGDELIAKVKELRDASKSDMVRSCGYVSTNKDGTERLHFTGFYEALLDARGIKVEAREFGYTRSHQIAVDVSAFSGGLGTARPTWRRFRGKDHGASRHRGGPVEVLRCDRVVSGLSRL